MTDHPTPNESQAARRPAAVIPINGPFVLPDEGDDRWPSTLKYLQHLARHENSVVTTISNIYEYAHVD